MISPTIPNSTSATSVGTGTVGAALSISKPGSLVNRDVLLLCISAYDYANLALPDGFDAVIDATNGSRRLLVGAKIVADANAEPATYTTTESTSKTATLAARLYRVSGANLTVPTENETTANNTLNGPDLTSSGNDRTGLVFYAGTSTSNVTVPQEVTLLNQAASTTGPGGEPNSRLAVGYKLDLTAGTVVVGNYTGGASATNCIVGSLCLRPADPDRNLTLLGVG